MAIKLCKEHGRQPVVFIYNESTPRMESSLDERDWLSVRVYLDEIIPWDIIIHRKDFNYDLVSEGMISLSKPVCKKCMEEKFNSSWTDLKIESV